MAWLSKVAQSFSETQSIFCSPASVRQNIPIPCIKFCQLLVCLQKTLMTQFIQTIREYTFQTFTSFHLAQYKCPERYFHKKILETDILSIPDNLLVSAILILPVTLAPLTGFRVSLCAYRLNAHERQNREKRGQQPLVMCLSIFISNI